MQIDLNRLKLQAEEEQAESESKSGGDRYPYKIVYPGLNGKLTLKLLYSVKSETVQRKIIRHDSGGGPKVVCLAQYGEDCPVCKAIKEVETNYGKDSGVFRKYGYKTRGLCYVQIIDHDSAYFTRENDPQKGDTVLLQYPITVYNDINRIIIDSISNNVNLISENEGAPIVIERSQKGKGFPEYKTYLFPYGSKKSFEDTADRKGTEIFDDMLSGLEPLNDMVVPNLPSEDIREKAQELANTILQEFSGTTVVNPGDSKEPPAPQERVTDQSTNLGDIGNAVPEQGMTPTKSGDVPECFGNHEDNAKKCMLCPYEDECFIKSN